MRLVNLLFDEEYEDVDIISVPDEIADDIDAVAQQFFRWVWIPENRQRFSVPRQNGTPVLSIDTEEFLWWLNNIYLPAGQTADVFLQHTHFRPELPTANF